MRESHLHDVGHEFPLEIGVGEPAVRVVARPSPAPEVNLVDGERRRQGLAGGPRGHPVAILPLVGVEVDHLRGGARGHFRAETVGVAAVGMAAGDVHPILGERANLETRHKNFPDPGRDPLVHPVGRRVPAVEVAHHRHAVGVRGPDGEGHAAHAVVLLDMRPEFLVARPVTALAEEMEVVVGEHGAGWRLEERPYNRDTRQGFTRRNFRRPACLPAPIVTDATVEGGEDGLRAVRAGGAGDRDQR